MAQAKEHADFTNNKKKTTTHRNLNHTGVPPSFKCYLIKKHTPKEFWNPFFNHF